MSRGARIPVVVDGRALTDGNRLRGIGSYLRGLLGAMAARDDVQVTVLTTDPRTVPSGLETRRIVRALPGRHQDREHRFLLPLDIARGAGSVFHAPAQTVPRWCPVPWVLTLHESDPAYWVRGADGAAGIIAVSHVVARRARETLGLREDAVWVAPNGVDPQFRPEPSVANSAEPYLLLVSQFEPRKGYPEALEVIAALAARGHPHHLRFVGQLPTWLRERVDQLVAESARPDLVEHLGYVPHQEMPRLYREAGAVLVTSRAEGFCLPALEAMACGVPVIAFANTAIEEVVGDGGLLVPDGDTKAMIDAADAVLSSGYRAGELSARARRRAAAFTWDRSAAIHCEAYASTAGRL